MTSTLRRLIPVLFCGALGYGCSAPPDLTGTPATTALVVVQGKIRKELLLSGVSSRIHRGMLVSTKDYETYTGASVQGCVVFSGLPPGQYRLRRVAGRPSIWNNWETWDYVVPADATPEFTIDVSAGDVRYVGQVVVKDQNGFGGMSRSFSVSPDRSGELRAIRQLRRTYPDTPWTAAFDGRVASLRN